MKNPSGKSKLIKDKISCITTRRLLNKFNQFKKTKPHQRKKEPGKLALAKVKISNLGWYSLLQVPMRQGDLHRFPVVRRAADNH